MKIDGLDAHTDRILQKHGLQIDLEGNEIVVRKPGTSLLLAYTKSVEEPRLVLTRSCIKLTLTASRSIGEFRVEAFQAAVSKARELGIITVSAGSRP